MGEKVENTKRGLSAAHIADLIRAQVVRGDETRVVYDIAGLEQATVNEIAFYQKALLPQRFAKEKLETLCAGVCVIGDHADGACIPQNVTLIYSPDAGRAFFQIAEYFRPSPQPRKGGFIHPSAWIHPSAVIGAQCCIEAFVVVDEGAQVGERCWLKAHCVVGAGTVLGNGCVVGEHASVLNCTAGQNVCVKPGARIGQRGFGFHMGEKGPSDYSHYGRVRLGDCVEIGANATVDRGLFHDTCIGAGSRVDNLVQIAHNSVIGERVILAAQVGVSGSTHIEDECVLGGQVGLSGHLCLGKGTRIAAKSGVMHSSSPGAVLAGIPAVPIQEWRRSVVQERRRCRGKEASKHVGEQNRAGRTDGARSSEG